MKRLPRSSGQAGSALGSLDPESHRARLDMPQVDCPELKGVICRSRPIEKLTFLQRLEHEPVSVGFSSQLRVDGSNQAVKPDLPPRRGRPHNVILQSGESWLGSGGELAGDWTLEGWRSSVAADQALDAEREAPESTLSRGRSSGKS